LHDWHGSCCFSLEKGRRRSWAPSS
jgi:hypothetical protein